MASWPASALPTRPELYDLKTDPGETVNLADQERPQVRRLHDELGTFMAREAAPATPEEEMPAELLEQLQALGYMGGTAPAASTEPGADPKDKIGKFRIANDLMRQALTRLHEADYQGSVARFEELLERGIDNAESISISAARSPGRDAARLRAGPRAVADPG